MSERTDLLLSLADDELILGWRNSEWTGIAPFLEEDVAFSSIAQNEIGHARALYELAAARARHDRRRARVRPQARRSTARLRSSSCAGSSGRARSPGTGSTRPPTRSASPRSRPRTTPRSRGSPRRSIARRRTTGCTRRCGSTACSRPTRASSRLNEAVDELWPYALGVLDDELRPELKARAERAARTCAPGRRGGAARRPRSGARRAVGGDDDGAALRARRIAMVTADEVWEALAEIPDPEIPVISLVDLGVVKDVAVDDGTVAGRLHADVHGLPGARGHAASDGGDDRRARCRAADIHVRLDDSWSTDDITAEGREKLRVAGFAPPTPRPAEKTRARAAPARLPLPVLRLDGDEAREPLRPDAVPLDPLLRGLPPAVRAVQDDLASRLRHRAS